MRPPGACLLVAALLPAILAADPGAAGPGAPLVLEQWIQDALPRHPDVREADIDVLHRARLAGIPRAWEDPEVRLGRESRQDRGDQTEVRVRVPLPNPWSERARRGLLEAAEALARNGRTTALVKAHAELKELFLEAVHRQQDERLLAGLAGELEQEVERAARLWEARQITAEGRLRLEAELAAARIRAARAAHRRGEAAAAMAALSGTARSGSDPLDTAAIGRDRLLAELPALGDLRRRALEGSPLVGRLEIIRHMEALEASGARARMLPLPEFVQGSWTRDRDAGRDDWTLAIQVSLPVFSYFRERSLANARAGRIDLLEQAQRDLIAQTLNEAHLKVQAARELVLTVEAAALPLIAGIGAHLESAASDPPVDRVRLSRARCEAHRELLEARFTLALRLLDLEAILGIHDPAPLLRQLLD